MATWPPDELVRWCWRTLPDDTRAFEALVAQYRQRVFATAFRVMRNYHDAEEQSQEVFLKVYRGIRGLNDPSTLSSWIYRLTVNTCLDALQRRRSPGGTSLDAGPEKEPHYVDTRTPTPEQSALHAELRRCLEATLWQLGPTERAMLVLRDVEGRAYQEIADTLSVSLSAVKMRIHRARLAFRRLFDATCPGLFGATSGVDQAGTS